MKRVVLLGFAVATFGLSMRESVAQESASSTKLTFKEAVNIGLKNNVALNTQKNTLAYTQLNRTSQMLRMGPTVQAQGSAYRVDGNSFNNNTGEVVNGVIDYVNGSISADMPIFNGMGQLNAYRQAKSTNDAQLHNVHRSSQNVIQLVSAQYLDCLLDVELIKIEEENVRTQQVQYDQIKTQVDLGSKAEADLFNQEYQLRNAELLLLRATNKLKNDKLTLALTLQLDPSTDIDLEPVAWDVNQVLADSFNIEDMHRTAANRRSDLKMAEETEKAAHYGYSSMKGSYYPSLYAGASYGSRYNYVAGESNRSFDEQFRKDNRQFSYGLSLTIPIYNGLRFRTQSALQRVNYENAKLAAKNTEVTVKSDVIRAYQNFGDAKTGYQAASAQLKAAELSYKLEKERYELGIADIVQLTTSNKAYFSAKSAYQNATYTLMFQKLLMEYAMGTLQFEDIP